MFAVSVCCVSGVGSCYRITRDDVIRWMAGVEIILRGATAQSDGTPLVVPVSEMGGYPTEH